ncbi:hypothetical protein [Paraliomyxa miuraensis]|nr:hypothetical protein [Paraliomyxa miuraensis]MCX4240206.1 hypothetical protein [Paraliomyxa miuraensis]
MTAETRLARGRDAKDRRHCPFGAFALALHLHLIDVPEALSGKERHHGQA